MLFKCQGYETLLWKDILFNSFLVKKLCFANIKWKKILYHRFVHGLSEKQCCIHFQSKD